MLEIWGCGLSMSVAYTQVLTDASVLQVTFTHVTGGGLRDCDKKKERAIFIYSDV